MTSQVRVYLRYAGFNISVQEFSKRAGIEPTRSHKEGEQVRYTKSPHNSWELDSGLDEKEEFEKHVEKLITILLPYRERLKALGRQFPPVLQGILRVAREDRPPLSLANEMIKVLAELNASVDIDIYHLSEGEE